MRVNRIAQDYRAKTQNRTYNQRPDVSFGNNQPQIKRGVVFKVLNWFWDGWVEASKIIADSYRMY